ncbi:hypothetical protein GN958_ATG08288 [Phytophthora infestans]|uniref:Uncharacterized protein n=1 Tax=Phytophthora infestans TaxID=4787 RepID=A0A8S9UTX5_PHYIN|nr:hypothetical protein GN958_ATG08288 [Phytophthora infestans]
MKLTPTLSTTLSMVAVLGPYLVSSHVYLVQPLAKSISVSIDKTPTIDSNKLFPVHYKKSKYKSLRAGIEDNQVLVSSEAPASCGFSSPEKTSYGAVNSTVYWDRSDDITVGEGFVHPGPCEVWCGDNRAHQDMTCDKTYNPPPGKGAAPVPIDKSLCKEATRLTFFW